ncbi:hypothetical protein GQX73_g1038 [Xylaria multiplex]|uniref:Uncharacterized protein n=1 Tax=Xylaria multiplex TaxID=323545 RepID=A0A7C8IUG3_9PEZI|nr:hypothetical protein GQX73_g1038 [Xylaria multiplex]
MMGYHLRNSIRAVRATTRAQALQNQQRAFLAASPLHAHQGYGDGKGDPVAEHPEKQPAATKAQESLEHPGPEPPDVGKGSSNAYTKSAFSKTMKEAASSEQSPEERASAQSGGSRSKEAVETGGSPTAGQIPEDGNGTANGGEALKGPRGENAPPQPKILNQSMHGAKFGLTDEQKREVERHNQDFERKHDRAEQAPRDKVDKKFWSGV